jgi:hypothetical protein
MDRKLALIVRVDTLDTGEVQPRLPGAEDVRDQDVPTPQIADVPFALTPPTSQEKPDRQKPLPRSSVQRGDP